MPAATACWNVCRCSRAVARRPCVDVLEVHVGDAVAVTVKQRHRVDPGVGAVARVGAQAKLAGIDVGEQPLHLVLELHVGADVGVDRRPQPELVRGRGDRAPDPVEERCPAGFVEAGAPHRTGPRSRSDHPTARRSGSACATRPTRSSSQVCARPSRRSRRVRPAPRTAPSRTRRPVSAGAREARRSARRAPAEGSRAGRARCRGSRRRRSRRGPAATADPATAPGARSPTTREFARACSGARRHPRPPGPTVALGPTPGPRR